MSRDSGHSKVDINKKLDTLLSDNSIIDQYINKMMTSQNTVNCCLKYKNRRYQELLKIWGKV